MKTRGHAAEAIASVLNELQGSRLQSDSRHADAYTRSRSARGYGSLRIAAELKVRGTADDLIRRVVADVEYDWVALAQRADRKKFGSYPDDSFDTLAKRRRFLEYRGFASEHIKAALKSDHELD